MRREIFNIFPPQTLVLILFIAVSLAFIYLTIAEPDVAFNATREDGVVEASQSVLYFLAAGGQLACFLLTLRFLKDDRKRRFFYLFFFIVFLLVAMEELSWGQRIFDISTPEDLSEINFQNETTLHNIDLHGSYTVFTVLQAMFLIGVPVVLPSLDLISDRAAGILRRLQFPLVHRDLMVCFGIALAFYPFKLTALSGLAIAVVFVLPLTLLLSKRFSELFDAFRYPHLQFFALAAIGLATMYMNLEPDIARQFARNISDEVREFLFGLGFLSFSVFEVWRLWCRRKDRGHPATTTTR